MTTPLEFLREAVRAVPAVKYALGIGGVVAAIAIIYSFKIDPRVAFVGTVVMLVLMGVLVVFARMSSLPGYRLAGPALVFTWFVLLLFMATSGSLFSSVFFQKPLDLSSWLTGANAATGADPAASAPAPAPEHASQAFNRRIGNDGSCTERNVRGDYDLCLAEGFAVANWTGAYRSARNGSATVERHGTRPNCVVLRLHYSDSGRSPLGDCKGNGWVDYDVTVNGTR